MASTVIAIIAVITVIYNTIVTHGVLKNDVKHLTDDVQEAKAGIARLERLHLKE